MQESWLDSLFSVYQIRICMSRDDSLPTCTEIYKNNSKSLIPNSRITQISLLIPKAINVSQNHDGILVKTNHCHNYNNCDDPCTDKFSHQNATNT